jgi:hypothetical protein
MHTLPENITLFEYLQLLAAAPRTSYEDAFVVAQQKAQLLAVWEHLENCLAK